MAYHIIIEHKRRVYSKWTSELGIVNSVISVKTNNDNEGNVDY